jgi:hypothetical protein
MEAIDGKFYHVTTLNGRDFGGIYLFSDRATSDIVGRIRNSSMIEQADLDPYLTGPGTLPPERQPRGRLPTRGDSTGDPRCLLVQPGDILTVTYENPDGTVLTATAQLQ